ncbi:MAG: hypothetical protein ABR947_01190 [Solirubrobacteraceae bacterium]
MQTVAWEGVANECERPFEGPWSEATTEMLPGTAGRIPSEPA